MKKILLTLILPAAVLTGCFKDKGSYDYGDWSEIISVEGIVIPGSATNGVTLSEGTILEINPVIVFRDGVNPDDYTYHWVLGGDTISNQKNLYWEVIPNPNIKYHETNKDAFFCLIINNTKSGQVWRIFAKHEAYMVKVKIVAATNPNIGIMVYTKPDNTLEWATIKGNNRSDPAAFTDLYLDMYGRYNTDRDPIAGPFAGASYDNDGSLAIYTDHAPDYGVLIEGRDGKTVPIGYFKGIIADETLEELPAAAVMSKTYFERRIQQILVGEKLYVSYAYYSDFPYQFINPNTGTPSFGNVAQAMHSNPAYNPGQVNILRKTTGELVYYAWNTSFGLIEYPLTGGSSQALTADKLIGVFKQPEYSSNHEILFYVVVRSGSVVNIHTFRLTSASGVKESIEYVDTKDITNWFGGITDETIWFSTIGKTAGNYAYAVKGNTLWRFSFLALENPVQVRTFPDNITGAYVVSSTYTVNDGVMEIYTAITTYNSTTNKSSIYFIDTMSADATQYSALVNAIDGKINIYIPYQN